MRCPKCNKNIPEGSSVCPHCHKVLTLVCPNCQTSNQSSVCSKCGYIILEKCSKCGRMVPTNSKKCRCGFPIANSIAIQECETDEFASLIINISALRSIRNLLGSQELYTKFLIKLKNQITALLRGVEGRVIIYGDDYVVNFNKELSFQTSVNKALRLALKIVNSFTGLNIRIQDELGTSLKMSLTIVKKTAEELLINKSPKSNVKLLTVKTKEKKYLKGLQIILDEYSQDCVSKDYKTDSLYAIEQDRKSVMYYEIILSNYVLPPDEASDVPLEVSKNDIKKYETEDVKPDDIFSFKVFDISAKCKFEKVTAGEVVNKLNVEDKIVSIRSERLYGVNTSEIRDFYECKGKKTIYVNCTEELSYKPWGILTELYKDYYNLPACPGLIDSEFSVKRFESIKNLITGNTVKASSYEDARYAYMEDFTAFLQSLSDTVVIIDGFENIDDTTIQTLGIYFDKFQKIKTNFVFITDAESPVHSKIKGLLRTPLYKEYSLYRMGISSLLSEVKEDASDFIQSFYYEKLKENYNGSRLYFENAIRYLMEKGVLISFENKLLIKNNSSFLLPKDINSLIRARLKNLGKSQEASLILAYSLFIGQRIDRKTLETLGIKDLSKNIKILEDADLVSLKDDVIYINNYNLLKPSISDSLKKEAEEYVAKTVLAKLGKELDNASFAILIGTIQKYKDEYLILWKNSQFAISAGDYDAYLKNCLGFLSLMENLGESISAEEIDTCKKEVFNNILASLYSYSPAKIYSIENILLMDAIRADDNEKIVKLSNLMLQGALISSDYTNALTLMYNILTRIPNPSLIVDGAINARFLLLSLVNIEILFNIGDYQRCIEIGNELLSAITPDVVEKIKPVNFSTSFFVSHLFDTFLLVGLSKIITGEGDLTEFYDSVKNSFGTDLPEKNCLTALKNFLAGENYIPSNIEGESPFSKAVYLILQEISELNGDYKNFAQNIYQAKLLASDIHHTQIEFICDLLIAHSYAKLGIDQKAHHIFADVLDKAEKSAIFNVIMFARYFIAKLKLEKSEYDEGMIIVNDALALIQKYKNQAKLFYVMFEKLYIEILKSSKNSAVDIESEEMKLVNMPDREKFSRIIKVFISKIQSDKSEEEKVSE